MEFSGVPKCNSAQKIWCHLKAFAMVSEKKLQNFGCRAIFTLKMAKNDKKIVNN